MKINSLNKLNVFMYTVATKFEFTHTRYELHLNAVVLRFSLSFISIFFSKLSFITNKINLSPYLN